MASKAQRALLRTAANIRAERRALARRIGARLRERRLSSGRDQRDVAADVGISQAKLCRIELGRCLDVPAWELTRIADVLGVTTEWVLGT